MTPGTGHHQVIFEGGAQTLSTVPLNRQARPTGVTVATYAIVDLRLGEDDPLRVIASGNATIDATLTTTTAAVGLGTAKAKELPVTSATGFVAGKHYLITDASGIRELVLAEGVYTGVVKLRNELAKRFDSGVYVAGIEVSCSFPSIEAAKLESLQDSGGPYAVDWSWDCDPSPKREIIWLVRHADSLEISEEELLAIDPTLTAVSGSRLSLATAIRTAALEVRALLQAVQLDPATFHGSATLQLAVAYRAAWHVLRHKDGDANQAKAKASKDESQKYLDTILIGRPPEKSVKTSIGSDSAVAGSDKTYRHWQLIS